MYRIFLLDKLTTFIEDRARYTLYKILISV